MSTQEAPAAITEPISQAEPLARRRLRARSDADKPVEPAKLPKPPKAEKPAKSAKPTKPERPEKPAKRTKSPAPGAELVIGGEPRVDLLPPEIKAKRATQDLQGRLFLGVLLVLVLVAAAVGGAWVLSATAQQQLTAEQARTGTLAAQQLKYAKVTQIESQTRLVQDAQHVAGATEIDWQGYLDKVQGTLPAGVTIKTVKVDSETPLVAYPQPSTPLLGARVATITFTASSEQLPDVPAWLDALSALPGFADANPDTVNLNAGQYSATITMHVNADAFDNRFAPKGK